MKLGRAALLATVATLVIAAAACTPAPTTTRVGVEGRGAFVPDISADGRWVVFLTSPGYPPRGDGTAPDTVLRLYDRSTGATSTLVAGNGETDPASISADGRYLAFTSYASDLVPGDTNGHADVFTLDRATGTITRITNSDADDFHDALAPAISGDGRVVAFVADRRNPDPGASAASPTGSGLFVWDRATGVVSQPPKGDEVSLAGGLSGDGRYLTARFTRWGGEVWRFDRLDGTWVEVSRDQSEWARFSSISADGRFVAYDAAPLADRSSSGIFVWDASTGTTVAVPQQEGDGDALPRMSAGGGTVAYSHLPAGSNGMTCCEMRAWDASSGSVTTVSSGTNGYTTWPVVSGDGKVVAYYSNADDAGAGADGQLAVYLWART